MSVLLVLGASSDLGCALIDSVAERYETIWATYRTMNENLEALVRKHDGRIRPVHADLSDKEDIEELIDTVRRSAGAASGAAIPDHIVHIPMAPYAVKKFVKTDEEDFEASMLLAIRSTVMPLQAFLPDMKKNRNGRVVFVLSSVTEGDVPEFQSAYVTVKYALLGLMKSLASEYAGTGVHINAVSPDMMDTRYISGLSHLMIEQYAGNRSGGKLLETLDVVPHIEHLLLDEGAGDGENILIV
ncbi:MAG: SDR family oxidoreductase [Lachnospiraceae bacterium]|nr:SDR family oxidoreductase [Lachnospiraceae bacterium]